ncbi:MAG TPA: type II toxin-antitoxin system RelE/ParE family toxin [Gemmatimonadaceae bacterium]|nr:type II toxin-antitoxin system RelE/ParE family toxin [Gemmatimonadaceae bacterium]
MTTPSPVKPLEWVGSALNDIRRLPEPVQDVVGYALHVAQLGEHPPEAKGLKGELFGILEIVADFDRGSYRAVYTVKLAGVVYVLHVFQKKSTRGIATPRREIELIKERYRWARAHHATHYGSQ